MQMNMKLDEEPKTTINEYLLVLFSFCIFGIFSWRVLQVRPGLLGSPEEQPLGLTGARLFTGRMPFLSPSQQCQSTGGKRRTKYKMRLPIIRKF